MENSPAQRAGFQDGDRVVEISVNGKTTQPETFQDLQIFLADVTDQEITFVVERGDERVTLKTVPEYNKEYDSYMIGIQASDYKVVKVNLLNCWYYGAREMGMLAGLMIDAIKQLFTGKNLEQLSGPVGIYSATEESVSYGLTGYLFLIAELSMNVGLFNLLPLPVLDGGQVVITIGEAIAGKKLNPKVKLALMGACWVLLIGMMLFVTFNDITKLMN
jgi:regulator of sigma E protease